MILKLNDKKEIIGFCTVGSINGDTVEYLPKDGEVFFGEDFVARKYKLSRNKIILNKDFSDEV